MQAAAPCDNAQDARLMSESSGASALEQRPASFRCAASLPDGFWPIRLRMSLDCRHPRDESLMDRPALGHDGLGDLACCEAAVPILVPRVFQLLG